MAETLGASFSIDVTNLKAGLAQANRLIKESESEFRAAAAGLDDWTQSEEGLSAKIKSLNTTTELQRKKVNALQSEYDRLISKGLDPASREAVELRTKINNETTALNKNEAELKNQTKALEELENGADDAGDATDEMGDSFGGLEAAGGIAVGAIAAVAAACVAAVGAFLGLAESTREARTNMARVETAFQTAELSAQNAADTMTTLYGIMGDEGAASEAAQQLAKISNSEKDLEANTRILTGVMAEYGASIPTEGLAEGMAATAAMGEVQGVLADALEWQGVNLDDYNAKLATLATEEERAAYIQSTLTDLYGASADAYRENNAEVIAAQEAQARLNSVMNELGAIAEPIMTSLKTLAADLLETIMPFVSLLGEGLTGALNGTAWASETLAESLSNIVTTLTENILAMLPTFIETVVSLVPQLVSSILNQLPTLLTTLVNLISMVLGAYSEMIPKIVDAILEVLPIFIEALLSAIPQLLEASITYLMTIVKAIPTIVKSLLTALPSIINTIISVLLESIPLILDSAVEMLMAIVDAIPDIVVALVAALPQIWTSVYSGLLSAVPKILEGALKLFGALITAVPKIAKELAGRMPEIISSIVSNLKNGISKISAVGSDIVKGLWNGINDMGTWIAKKIKGFGEGVLGGIKDFFGIKSPSRVMANTVGKPIVQGLAQGVEDNGHIAVNAMEELSKDMLESESEYLAEKERIERERAEAELATRLANAKNAAEIEKIKQDEINKAAKDAQDAYLADLKARADEEKKAYEAMQKEMENFASKVYGDMGAKFVTITYGDNERYILPDIKGENKNLETYSELVDELIARYGVLPEQIIENLKSMSVEDATKYVRAMLNATEKQWNDYVEGFEERHDIADKLGMALFPEQALLEITSSAEQAVGAVTETIETDFNELAQSLDESLGNMTAAAEELNEFSKGLLGDTENNAGGLVVNQTNNFQQAYTSPYEKYKARKELFAAARLVKAGAY